MYTRVTTYQIQPAKVEEVKQIGRESVVPAIKQQQGFNSFMSLVNSATGKAMLVTVFETEADMRAGLSMALFSNKSLKLPPSLMGHLPANSMKSMPKGKHLRHWTRP